MRTTFFNVGILNALITYPLYRLLVWRGLRFEIDDLPTLKEFLAHAFAYFVVEEIVFYYSHRLYFVPHSTQLEIIFTDVLRTYVYL